MQVRVRSGAVSATTNSREAVALVSAKPRLRVKQTQFRVLVADPPWQHGDALGKRGAKQHYKNTLSLAEIMAFPIPPLADDCVLFLWRVSQMVEEAYEVARAWGFTPNKGELVWRKMTPSGKEHFGMGYVVRGAHETCMIAKRGRPKILRRDVRSVFSAVAPRINGKIQHSAKPHAFFSLVNTMFDGPRASLFERTPRYGYTCFGNELMHGDDGTTIPADD